MRVRLFLAGAPITAGPSRGLALFGGSAGPAAPSTSSISPTTATQWDAQTTLTVNGAGFVSGDTVYCDAVALVTTFVNSGQLTAVLPAAEAASSVLQTSGAKSITVVGVNGTSNAKTLTVSAWTWTTPSGCNLVLDGDASNMTFGTGSAIAQWNDTSGIGNHYSQGTAANQPTHTTALAALNNRGAVDCDGTNDVLSGPATSALITASAYTMLAVFVADAIDTNAANYYDNDGILCGAGGHWGMHLKSTPVALAGNFDGGLTSATVAITTGAGQVIGQRHASGNLYIRNGLGAESSVVSGDTTNVAAVTVIGRQYDIRHFDGKIGLLAVWNVNLSTADYERGLRKAKVYFGL